MDYSVKWSVFLRQMSSIRGYEPRRGDRASYGGILAGRR